MSSNDRFRFLKALLIAVFLFSASGPVLAAEGARLEAESHAIDRLLDWLSTLWGDVGCIVDPSGQCGDASETGENSGEGLDVGCIVDPNGGPCRENG